MNDIPLLFCLPFAYIFGLLDDVNAIVGVALTLLDLIFMVFYLSYDEEFSIDSKMVFDLASKRLEQQDTTVAKLFNDNISIELVDEADSLSNDNIDVANIEHEALLTDN